MALGALGPERLAWEISSSENRDLKTCFYGFSMVCFYGFLWFFYGFFYGFRWFSHGFLECSKGFAWLCHDLLSLGVRSASGSLELAQPRIGHLLANGLSFSP